MATTRKRPRNLDLPTMIEIGHRPGQVGGVGRPVELVRLGQAGQRDRLGHEARQLGRKPADLGRVYVGLGHGGYGSGGCEGKGSFFGSA